MLPQQSPQGHVEPTPHQPQHALALLRPDARSLHELPPRFFQQSLPRPAHPARGRRAVHAVEGADFIDGQPIHEVLAEQVLLACVERRHGGCEGLAEGLPVELLHVRQLGIVLGGAKGEHGFAVAGRRLLPAHAAERGPGGGDAEPAGQVAPACVFGDAGRGFLAAHQEQLPKVLRDVVGVGRSQANAPDGATDARHVGLVERAQCGRVSQGACACQVKRSVDIGRGRWIAEALGHVLAEGALRHGNARPNGLSGCERRSERRRSVPRHHRTV